MTRDEIYDHLARVYIGKKNKVEQERKKLFNAWLSINILITFIIFAGAFYGLTAFLTHQGNIFQNKIIYSLNKGPIRVRYNLIFPNPQIETFTLSTPHINAGKFKNLQFSIRGLEGGVPGTMRIELRNRKDEKSSVFVKDINRQWKSYTLSFDDFKDISDWSDIASVSFVLESWNVEQKKGIVLIDEVCFSS